MHISMHPHTVLDGFQLCSHTSMNSSPCFALLPSKSTVQSSQALGTAWGERHVWLPGTSKQQQLTLYIHSLYREHYPTHTTPDYTPCSLETMDVFIDRQDKQRKSWCVMVRISYGVCMHACLPLCMCVISLWLLTLSGRCEQASGLFHAGLYWYGFLTGSLTLSLDLLFHVFPPFNCGRHGQTALHPATWLELHVFYEWHRQAHAPRMTVCVCACVLCISNRM